MFLAGRASLKPTRAGLRLGDCCADAPIRWALTASPEQPITRQPEDIRDLRDGFRGDARSEVPAFKRCDVRAGEPGEGAYLRSRQTR